MHTFTDPHTTLDRICVRPPYFALEKLTVAEPGRIACAAPVELAPTDREAPVAMAEGARHCAIAGLVAAATTAPDDARRYYLAQRATLERRSAPDPGAAPDLVDITATGTLATARKATAEATMTAAGTELYTLSIDYAVLDEPAFAKVFAHLRAPSDREAQPNPYTSALPLRDVRLRPASATATIRAGRHQCAGHFHDYPAVPVAYLLTAEFGLGRILSHELLGTPDVVLRRGILAEARTLVPAETPVQLEARPVARSATSCDIEVTAAADGQTAFRTIERYELGHSC